MMPNANNLAMTLVSELGKTQTKNSKSSNLKKEDFSKLFANPKKEEKKKTVEETGANMLQFKFAENPFNSKNLTKVEKGAEKVEGVKTHSKTQSLADVKLGIKPELKAEFKPETKETKSFELPKGITKPVEQNLISKKELSVKTPISKETPKSTNVAEGKTQVKNLETANTEMVLGKRIESTKSTNLKLDNEVGVKLTEGVKEKTPVNVQNLKKENFKGEIAEPSKIPSLEVKNADFSEVQNKGRSTNVFTKGNPLNNLEIQAKNDPNFVVSETKRTEPNVPTLSSYGLKKFNEGIKLEEKIEGAKELQLVQKNVLNEKLGEKGEIAPLTQNIKPMNFEKAEVINLNKLPQNTDFSNVMQQVENGIKINYNNQLKEMKIRLQPEELGEVEVKMTIENNIMKAQFVVESQTVKEILEAKFDTLRNALENKGFSGAEINVSVSTGDNKKSQNSFVFNEGKKGTSTTKDYSSKVENLENNSKINKISSSSGIDIMV